jgi:hypothetical protein
MVRGSSGGGPEGRSNGRKTCPAVGPNPGEPAGTRRQTHAALPGCSPAGLIDCADRAPPALVVAANPIAR